MSEVKEREIKGRVTIEWCRICGKDLRLCSVCSCDSHFICVSDSGWFVLVFQKIQQYEIFVLSLPCVFL